jgi:AdoMet-dependent heme synthase
MRHGGAANHPGGPGGIDFSKAPFLVIWETTRACDLVCKHCRAEAVPERHPGELSTLEAKRLMDQVREFGRTILVLSGGDCFKRPDIVELIGYGSKLGLRMAITPATTPLATRELLQQLKDAGLARLAVSLDGSTPEIHDEFRQVPGSFEHGKRILALAHEVGLTTQVNTVFSNHNLHDFDGLAALMEQLGIVFWEVFFIVPTGRAKPGDVASAAEFEKLFHRMYDLSKTAPFDLKATAGPQYGRVVVQRQVAERRAGEREAAPDPLGAGVAYSQLDGIGRARGVNDGDGFVFISHTGEICPSGFLPLVAGNIRQHDLLDVYRNSRLFRDLRDRSAFKGKCGVCEYLSICGGSRARAYAMTGDYLEAEPFCDYIPVKWRKMMESGEAEAPDAYFERRWRWKRSLPVLEAAGQP